MPQMPPTYWLLFMLYYIFIFIFIIMLTFIYFSFLSKPTMMTTDCFTFYFNWKL